MQWACKFFIPSFRDFRPRKQEALVRRERVRLVVVGERGGLLAGFVDGLPKVGLQRADENLDVPFLHVRVLTGSIFVVWVPGSVAPSLLELLADMFQRAIMTQKSLSRSSVMLPQRNGLKPRSIFSST